MRPSNESIDGAVETMRFVVGELMTEDVVNLDVAQLIANAARELVNYKLECSADAAEWLKAEQAAECDR